MRSNSRVLAQYEEFGSISRCEHGCVHVQLGFIVMTMSEAQFMRFVAMVSDGAANFEYFRAAGGPDDAGPAEG